MGVHMSTALQTQRKALHVSNGRDIVIDLIKTIAIFGVLTIHASTGANSNPIGF